MCSKCTSKRKKICWRSTPSTSMQSTTEAWSRQPKTRRWNARRSARHKITTPAKCTLTWSTSATCRPIRRSSANTRTPPEFRVAQPSKTISPTRQLVTRKMSPKEDIRNVFKESWVSLKINKTLPPNLMVGSRKEEGDKLNIELLKMLAQTELKSLKPNWIAQQIEGNKLGHQTTSAGNSLVQVFHSQELTKWWTI